MNKFLKIINERDSAYDRITGEALQQIVNFLQAAEDHLKDEQAFPEKYSILWMSCDVRKKEDDEFVHVAGLLYLKESVEKTKEIKDDNFINQVIRISVPLEVALLQNKEEVKTYLALVSTSLANQSENTESEKETNSAPENTTPDFDYSNLSDEQKAQISAFKSTSEVFH